MNDLDAIIAQAEVLERSMHDELLAAGEDEQLLAELAAEVVEAQEPTDDERAAFGLVYRMVTGLASATLAEPGRAPLLDPANFLSHVEDKSWIYDEHAGALLHVSEPAHGWPEQRPFTPMAFSSDNLLRHLDHELQRAAAEIVEEACRAGRIFSSMCTRFRMAAYLDPEAHIEPVRLRRVVHDAARGALRSRGTLSGSLVLASHFQTRSARTEDLSHTSDE